MVKPATEWKLTIDYQNLIAQVPVIKPPSPNIIEMIDDVQKAQGP